MDSEMPTVLSWCIMQYTVCPCLGLVSCPFYAIPIIIHFLIYEIFHLLVSFHFLLLLAVTIIECNNNFLFFTSIIILIKYNY